MGTCILVLGSTRSGTSVVSGVLHRLGVVMGWELIPENGATERYDWPDPWEMNPTGFFQDAPVENVQDAMWGDDYPAVGERPTNRRLVDEYQRLIRMRVDRRHPLWGIKASRNQWMVPEFLEACSNNVKFVVTRREQAHSSQSLRSWYPQYPQEKCDKWVRRANIQISNVLADPTFVHIPRHVVVYENLHAQIPVVIKQLADFVGRPVKQEAIDFVKPELRRVR